MVQPILPPPPDDAKLWRYMNFVKFVYLLNSKSLYFVQGASLIDKFEGAMGSADLLSKYNDFYSEFLRDAYRTRPDGSAADLSTEQLEASVKKSLESLHQAGEWQRETTYLNCWHEAEHESEAMWRLYADWRHLAADDSGGIVVVSTFRRLSDGLSSVPNLYVGRVKYVDYTKQLVGINEAFWNKSMSFQHEREVRAVLRDHRKPQPTGISIPVKVDDLIAEVRLSPRCPEWFENLVRDVALLYRCTFEVKRSALEISPFY
ncbi:MAG TPA: hypothetical protein VGR70_12195 [Stellaceae bacterium]|nr:hypothetical protein [Stellaceae bacterium]